MNRCLTPIALVSLVVACATPHVEPVQVSPLVPGSREKIVIDQAMLLFDSSGSISRRNQFPAERALFESLALSMPDGDYQAGAIAFGGLKRETRDLAPFDRAGLQSYAQALKYLSEGTPLHHVLGETGKAIAGLSERAAVVLFSDGLPTDSIGSVVDPDRSVDAAKAVIDRYQGQVCFHTIQVGNDPAGTAFLNRLAVLTRCGSARNADSLGSAAAIHAFQRQVFLGDAPPPKPAPVFPASPRDSDGDGVYDDADQCPGTPTGAMVDERGCWVLEGLTFATNSAEIDAASRVRLSQEVVPVLLQNPKVRLSVDGHTDSSGSAAYNQQLSARRANAVRDFLISEGVDAGRLEARGFGEERPIVPDDSPANMRKNRRSELTVIR